LERPFPAIISKNHATILTVTSKAEIPAQLSPTIRILWWK
jgi:hypothetical protein